MAVEAVDLMREHGLTLCFAESCTAGGVPKVVTSVPGASEVFIGGIIAYRKDALAKAIRLSLNNLEREGGVSRDVTALLAQAGLRQFGANVCIATTGYLGPFNEGDRHEGWVVVMSDKGDELHTELHLDGKREANRQKMLRAAFELLLQMLKTRIEIKDNRDAV
jgi:nicotinamide-nucleotide amidase